MGGIGRIGAVGRRRDAHPEAWAEAEREVVAGECGGGDGEREQRAHVSGFAAKGDPESPTSTSMDDKRFDIWVAPGSLFMRQMDADGKVVRADGADLETETVWGYEASDGVRYVADVRQQREAVARVLKGNMRLLLESQFAVISSELKDRDGRGDNGGTDGRALGVITVIGEGGSISLGPGAVSYRKLRMRFVFEVDKETDRLLCRGTTPRPRSTPRWKWAAGTASSTACQHPPLPPQAKEVPGNCRDPGHRQDAEHGHEVRRQANLAKRRAEIGGRGAVSSDFMACDAKVAKTETAGLANAQEIATASGEGICP